MLDLLERLHGIAYVCLLVMSAVLVVYAYANRKTPGARRIGALWAVPLAIELAYWFLYYQVN